MLETLVLDETKPYHRLFDRKNRSDRRAANGGVRGAASGETT